MFMGCKFIVDMSHYPKDAPFEVPEGWAWCKIGDIAIVARGGSPRPIENYLTTDSSGINWIKIGDAEQGGKYINSTKQKITHDGVSRSRIVHAGDFLLTNSMSFGRPYILNIDGCIHDGWLVISPLQEVINKDFFFYLLSSDFAYQQFSEQASGAVVSNLNKDKVAEAYIPLPPVREQAIIVKAIEAINLWIENIEQEQCSLFSLLSYSKEKILDLAIHGKLVTQDPTEEPAIELLKRINPNFTPSDNLHYKDCPEGWTIATVSDVFDINPKVHGRDEINAGFVPMTKICDGFYNKFSYEVRKWAKIKNGFTRFADGDIAVAKISPCLENRKSVIMSNLPNGIGAGTTELNIFRSKVVDPEYGLLFFKSDYFIKACACSYNGVVGQQRVSRSLIEGMQFLLPPMAEQKRIVKAVNRYFDVINRIESTLQ